MTDSPAHSPTELPDTPVDRLLALGLSPEQADAASLAAALPEYDQLTLLGSGGMGVVWRARQIRLDRPVAIKVLRSELADDPSFAERFAREAQALARLQHPGIVAVHDFGEVLGRCYLVMEYVDGADLRAALGVGITPDQSLAIVPQLCDALQYAHEHGVVHRDIKPENILVDRNGRVKIADFGLAKLRSTESTRATSSGRILGTPHYMAPEQIDRPTEVDHRADIFALGVVTYEMLTGKLPIGVFEPPSRVRSMDARFDEVVMRALEHDRERRYQHASEVKERVVALGPTVEWTPTPADEIDREVEVERRRAMGRGGLSLLAFMAFSIYNNCWIDLSDGWTFGGTPGHRFGKVSLAWSFLALLLVDYVLLAIEAYRKRHTLRGAVLGTKLALFLALVFATLGITGLVKTGAAFSLSMNPFVNGIAWLVFAAAGARTAWVYAVERGIPARIVLGPTWWIPRWVAQLDPRGRETAMGNARGGASEG